MGRLQEGTIGRGPGLFILATAVWLICVFMIGTLRDVYALVHTFDTGLYLQLLHNISDAFVFDSSVTGESNFLAHHFQPVLIPLSYLVMFLERPITLFLIGLVAIVFSLVLMSGRRFNQLNALQLLVLFMFAAQPALATAMSQNFTPDILALPAFCWMAGRLVDPERNGKPWQWLMVMAWAGLCKESYLIIVGVVAFCLFLQTRKAVWLVVSSVFFLLFGWLFFSWMPGNSNMTGYYGLSFYLPANELAAGDGRPPLATIAAALLSNLFSLRTLVTLALLTLLTGGLWLLKLRLVLIPALAGFAFIAVSHSSQVHHPANHYLLAVLPFLTVAALANAADMKTARLGRWLVPVILCIGLIPVAYSSLTAGGLLSAVAKVTTVDSLASVRADAARARRLLHPDMPVVMNGTLQPLFPDFRNVELLLSFRGNPHKLNLEARSEQDVYFLLTKDIRAVEDCRTVKVGGEGMRIDYSHFRSVCELLKREGREMASFPASGLVMLVLPGR